ncbi:MAG: hypothetical protein ACM3ZC_06135 [Bacteroidota bacterium]
MRLAWRTALAVILTSAAAAAGLFYRADRAFYDAFAAAELE